MTLPARQRLHDNWYLYTRQRPRLSVLETRYLLSSMIIPLTHV